MVIWRVGGKLCENLVYLRFTGGPESKPEVFIVGDAKSPSRTTLHWLVRQLAKHEFVRVKAEDKPESKKTTKKEEQK